MDLEKINKRIGAMVEEGLLPEAWVLVALHEQGKFEDIEIVSSLGPYQTMQVMGHSTIEMDKELKNQNKEKH